MRDEVTAQIAALLAGFVNTRNQGLREAVSQVRGELDAGQEALGSFASKHAAEADRAMETAAGLVEVLQEKEKDGARIKENGLKVGCMRSCKFLNSANVLSCYRQSSNPRPALKMETRAYTLRSQPR